MKKIYLLILLNLFFGEVFAEGLSTTQRIDAIGNVKRILFKHGSNDPGTLNARRNIEGSLLTGIEIFYFGGSLGKSGAGPSCHFGVNTEVPNNSSNLQIIRFNGDDCSTIINLLVSLGAAELKFDTISFNYFGCNPQSTKCHISNEIEL